MQRDDVAEVSHRVSFLSGCPRFPEVGSLTLLIRHQSVGLTVASASVVCSALRVFPFVSTSKLFIPVSDLQLIKIKTNLPLLVKNLAAASCWVFKHHACWWLSVEVSRDQQSRNNVSDIFFKKNPIPPTYIKQNKTQAKWNAFSPWGAAPRLSVGLMGRAASHFKKGRCVEKHLFLRYIAVHLWQLGEVVSLSFKTASRVQFYCKGTSQRSGMTGHMFHGSSVCLYC